jgi:glycosyltransferase involved in cell wall biosynthesis
MIFKISVVIPLYNKSDYIQRAIESVLAQKVPVDEIIVVDDGSTDDGANVVNAMANEKIKLVKQRNQGVSIARNNGVEVSNNEYVLLLDADDIWLPHHTIEIAKLAEKFPDAGLLATAYAFQTGSRIKPAKLRGVPKQTGLLCDYFLSCIKADLPVTASSVALKKSSFNSIGKFPVGMKMGEDQLVWSRIAYQYDIAYSNNVSVYYDRDVEMSACKVNLITDLAPHIKDWSLDLRNGKVPEHLRLSLAKLLHFSALYCVKNNLILNNKYKARKILLNEKILNKDIYWYISVLLTFLPHFVIKRVF